MTPENLPALWWLNFRTAPTPEQESAILDLKTQHINDLGAAKWNTDHRMRDVFQDWDGDDSVPLGKDNPNLKTSYIDGLISDITDDTPEPMIFDKGESSKGLKWPIFDFLRDESTVWEIFDPEYESTIWPDWLTPLQRSLVQQVNKPIESIPFEKQ